MRTSKKLLSFFLAVVMVVTTCSVGFTAFAQQSSDSIWTTPRNGHEAEDTFNALDSLANQFLPGVLMGIEAINSPIYSKYAKEYAEKHGVKVEDLTADQKKEINEKANSEVTIAEILEVLSPTLINALASTSKADFVKLVEGKQEVSDSYLKHYNYLDLEENDNRTTFYTVYALCKNYKDNQSLDSETRKVLSDWFDALDPLAQKYLQLLESEQNFLTTIRKIAQQAGDNDTISRMNLAQLSIDYTIAEDEQGDVQKAINETNKLYKPYMDIIPDSLLSEDAQGNKILVDGIASYAYYTKTFNQRGSLLLSCLRVADLLDAAGTKVVYEGKEITSKNFLETLSVSESDAIASLGDAYTQASDADKAKLVESEIQTMLIEKYYDVLVENGNHASMDNKESYSEYYVGMLKGLLLKSGKYSSVEEIEKAVAAEMPKPQLDADGKVVSYIQDEDLAVLRDAASIDNLDIEWEYVNYSEYLAKGTFEYKGTTYNLPDGLMKTVDGNKVPLTSMYYLAQVLHMDVNTNQIIYDRNWDLSCSLMRNSQSDTDMFNKFMAEAELYCYSDLVVKTYGDKAFKNSSLDAFGNPTLLGLNRNTFVYSQADIVAAVEYLESLLPSEDDDSNEVVLSPEEKYNPDDYDFNTPINGGNSTVGIDLVNFILNRTVVDLVSKPLIGSTSINDLVNSLLVTPVDLKIALNDIYMRAHSDAVKTVFELLPVLTVLIDELILPIFVNGEGDSQNGTGGFSTYIPSVLRALPSLGVNINLPEIMLDSGSYIGITDLTFDLNELLPQLMHWLLRDTDSSSFKYYEGKDVVYSKPDGDKHIPIETKPADVKASDVVNYSVKDNNGNALTANKENGNVVSYTYLGKTDKELAKVLEAAEEDTTFTYTMTYESNVPLLTGIYIADKALRDAKISDLDNLIAGLTDYTTEKDANGNDVKVIKKDADGNPIKTPSDTAIGLTEMITELATFFSASVDEFVATPKCRDAVKVSYNKNNNEYSRTCSGLNNLTVAIPQLLDIMENKAAEKYGVDKSLWTYCYDGKFIEKTVTIQNKEYLSVDNAVITEFKNYAVSDDADRAYDILDTFAGLFVEDWLNAIVSLLNNTFTTDNKLSKEIPIISGILTSLGGFGEQSVVTELLNGVFQLTRDDDYSFTFEKRENGFNGLTKNHAYFLLTNITTLVDVIKNLSAHFTKTNEAKNDTTANINSIALSNQADPASKAAKANSSSYTNEELENVSDLIGNLDKMLSSLLSDATVNDFSIDSAENIAAGVISVLSKYLGRDCSSDLVKLVNNYLYFINGGSDGKDNEFTADENNNVDAKNVYTNKELTTLVVETFLLLESITENLLAKYSDNYDRNGNAVSYNLLVEAIEGVISPDTVQIRLGDYKDAQKEITKLDCWHDAVKANNQVDISIDWGIKDGDKDAFFKGLASSLRLVTSVLGVLLVDTGWYETVVMPILDAVCTPNGVAIDTPEQFAALSADGYRDETLLGLIRPVAGLINAVLAKPATALINSITGLAGILDDNNGETIASIVNSALKPICDEIYGLGNIVGNLSPTFQKTINAIADDKIAVLGKTENNALVNIKVGPTNNQYPLSGSNIINIINAYIGGLITLPPIDWSAVNKAASPADALVYVLDYAVNAVLDNKNLSSIASLINNETVKTLITAIQEKNLTAKDIFAVLNKVLDATDNPTLVYWSFEKYLLEKIEGFSYPTGISKTMASNAVTNINAVIDNIFPVLKSLGIDIGDSLADIVSGLFTNANITSLVKAVYGAVLTRDSNGNPTLYLSEVLSMLGIASTPKEVAKILTDKSYGASFTSAANTLSKASSWDKVTTVNWGFTDGSAKAQQGFVNALAAALRPLNDILAVFLNEGTAEFGDMAYNAVRSLEIPETLYQVQAKDANGNPMTDENGNPVMAELTYKLTYQMKNGVLTLKLKDANRQYSATSTFKVDFNSLKNTLTDLKLEGTNGYNSAVIPLLEAFQCKNIKTYAQYQADAAAAKDNLLLDILNPILGSDNSSLISQLCAKPVETLTTLLPNLAVYLDAHGLSQAVSNLLAPVTEIIYTATKVLDLNGLIEKVLGAPLGDYVGNRLGMKPGELVIDLSDLTTLNIEDIVIPIVNKVLSGVEDSNLNKIRFDNINWNALISLGTRTTYTSKATGEDGNALTGKKLTDVDYGKVLITVLRYVLDNVKANLGHIKAFVFNLKDEKGNNLITDDIVIALLNNVFDQLNAHSSDQIIAAIYYFLVGNNTAAYWDYTDYITKNFKFSYPDGVTEKNVAKLTAFIDGIVDELDLEALLEDNLYTDNIVNALAKAIYTNIDSVSISDTIKLSDILSIVGITTDTKSVASLLKDKSYGETKQFAAAAKAIANASDWSKVNFDKLTWGVKDKATFLKALVAILRPLDGLLDVILADGKLQILEGINIPGSNAYESTIVPLLEAFRCTGLKSYDKYLADKNKATDNLLLDILNPLFGLVDDVIESPVDAIASRLPNIALFIANNGLIQLIENLITPIVAILVDVNPIIDVDRLLQELIGDESVSVTNLAPLLEELIGQDKIVPLINTLLVGTGIEISDINWFKLASLGTVKNEASVVKCIGKRIVVDGNSSKVVISLLRYVLDTVLKNGDAIKGLLGNTYKGTVKEIIDLIFGLKSDELLSVVFALVDITQSPTEVYWCYEHYKELNKKFAYPASISAKDADNAVGQLDNAVSSVFALLAGLDVVNADNLAGLVNDLLFTNEMVTKLAKALYGSKALGSAKVAPYIEMAGIDLSTKGIAAILMDKSYGNTFSSAASTLKKASSWDKVSKVNWGFKDGSAKAEQGFVNAVVGVLRPFIDILAPFLNGSNLELGNILYNIVTNLDLSTGNKSKGETLVTLKNGKLTIKTQTNGKYSTLLALDLANLDTLKSLNLYGSNGYENAIVPLLDAFQVDNVKTYKQYKADCKKAKDNVLLDVLNPVLSFVDDVLEAPFDTVTSVLPNVAYFIDNGGVTQLLDNLLSPVTEFLKEAKKQGVDIDKILKIALGKDLGKVITDAIGIKGVSVKLKLTDISSCNIQEIVLPLINSILKNKKIDIKLPDFKWSTIASHGKLVTSKSAAKNTEGKFTNKEVIADKGETLVAVLRYLAQTIVSNASGIKNLLCNIDAIKKNDTVASIIRSVFNQISTSPADSIVTAIFYLLKEEPTNAFWDYTGYTFGEYKFSYPGSVDKAFLKQLPLMLDGTISSMISLNDTIGNLLFKDELISKLAVGLYGAVEGVKINDSTTLTQLLAQTGIDFSTKNVAKLLVDEKYGQSFSGPASVIASAGSWKSISADSLKWGVKDSDTFFHALVAVLRPIYGVLDVLLNDASLGLFDIIRIPGSNGYTSSIVPLMEAFSMYNVKTQYQYRQDINEEYDAILLDIINPLWDKVEDILNAPLQTLFAVLPNLALFIGNDGLCQIIDNLFTPISALVDALKPVVDLNDLLTTLFKALKFDLGATLAKVGITNFSLDIYDLNKTLKQILGADAIIPLLNGVLGVIEIKGQPLGLKLNDIDWLQLASHGKTMTGTSQAATYGSRIFVEGNSAETLIAVLRYLIETVNAGDNFDKINNLISGLLSGAGDGIASAVGEVLGILQDGETDEVIAGLVDLLQQIAG